MIAGWYVYNEREREGFVDVGTLNCEPVQTVPVGSFFFSAIFLRLNLTNY